VLGEAYRGLPWLTVAYCGPGTDCVFINILNHRLRVPIK
jgi:hypothetical protein